MFWKPIGMGTSLKYKSKPCHSDGTCPHQVRFGRVFAPLECSKVQILGQSALDVDRFRQNDKA